jgi:hypothetical protein
MLLLLLLLSCCSPVAPTAAMTTVSVTANLSSSPRVVPEAFDSLIMWGREETQWGVLGNASLHGADSRAADYRFLPGVPRPAFAARWWRRRPDDCPVLSSLGAIAICSSRGEP